MVRQMVGVGQPGLPDAQEPCCPLSPFRSLTQWSPPAQLPCLPPRTSLGHRPG